MVLLPAPVGPTRAVVLPCLRVKERLFTTGDLSAYEKETFEN